MKIFKIFLRKVNSLFRKIRAFCYKFLSDKVYYKKIYKERTGKDLNLDNPKTFDEKLNWINLNYRNPLMTMCVDKFWVREYVKMCGYENILNELYGVYDNVEDIEFSKFKDDKIFIKCNHGSGTNILFDRNNPFDIHKFKKEFSRNLKQNYYSTSREWPYKNVKPLIICEKVLTTNDKAGLVDYRMLCFNGKLKYVFLSVGSSGEDGRHGTNGHLNVYDRNLNLMKGYKFNISNFDSNIIKKPDNFEKMVEIAETLSKPFPHARIDLYNISGKIVFGEITFFHRGGINPEICPKEFDLLLGSFIDIDKIKNELKIK